MEIHLRGTLCGRNSGISCHPVEHFKPRYQEPQVTVFLCRDALVPPLSGLTERVSLFFFLRESCDTQAFSPLPSLHPKDCGKMPPSSGPGIHTRVKRQKVSNPKHITIITVKSPLERNSLPHHLWKLPQLLLILYSFGLTVDLLQFELGHFLSLTWSLTCS